MRKKSLKNSHNSPRYVAKEHEGKWYPVDTWQKEKIPKTYQTGGTEEQAKIACDVLNRWTEN